MNSIFLISESQTVCSLNDPPGSKIIMLDFPQVFILYVNFLQASRLLGRILATPITVLRSAPRVFFYTPNHVEAFYLNTSLIITIFFCII